MPETPPILFLIFNRPDKTRRVLETIRAARPARLYVAADGPRADRPAEPALCDETRAVLDSVDWPCEVKTLFRDRNLGCRRAVAEGISWFFEHEPEGIILEDDIVTDPSFFPFAAEMLDRYRDDPRVMTITACNMQPPDRSYDASYYFSAFIHVWGWASWRRAWDLYDWTLDDLETKAATDTIKTMCPVPNAVGYWLPNLKGVRDGQIDTWDYSWLYTQWKHRGMTVTPKVNLMQNIGFDETATHTTSAEMWEASLRASSLSFPLQHPKTVERYLEADTHVATQVFQIQPVRLRAVVRRIAKKLGRKVQKRIKRLVRRQA